MIFFLGGGGVFLALTPIFPCTIKKVTQSQALKIDIMYLKYWQRKLPKVKVLNKISRPITRMNRFNWKSMLLPFKFSN